MGFRVSMQGDRGLWSTFDCRDRKSPPLTLLKRVNVVVPSPRESEASVKAVSRGGVS